jgi:hypothetical protein
MPGSYDPGDDLVMPKIPVITEDTGIRLRKFLCSDPYV